MRDEREKRRLEQSMSNQWSGPKVSLEPGQARPGHGTMVLLKDEQCEGEEAERTLTWRAAQEAQLW